MKTDKSQSQYSEGQNAASVAISFEGWENARGISTATALPNAEYNKNPNYWRGWLDFICAATPKRIV